MATAKKWQLVKVVEGRPTKETMEIQTEELPSLQPGDVLFEALYLSLDPYIWAVMAKEGKTDKTVIGQQVSRVAESRDDSYKVGDVYLGSFGWRTHTIINPGKGEGGSGNGASALSKVPDLFGLSPSLMLGVCGMPGVTAVRCLEDYCDAKPGDVIFIGSAAGVVGSIIGQLAKLKGCHVIGCAGSNDKLDWLKQLGFDDVFNYKTDDLSKSLKKYAPNGVDIYIELIGGEFGLTVLCDHMAFGGRVIGIGSVSTYNRGMKPHSRDFMNTVIFQKLKIQGYLIFAEDAKKYEDAQKELIQLVKNKKLTYVENVVDGFTKARDGYIDFMSGRNHGKTVVKV